MSKDFVRVIDTDGNVLEHYILKPGEELAVVNKKKELTDKQIEFLNSNKELKEYNESLGGFITMCYIKNELLFNHLNLELSNISRIIYLATYLSYNDKEEGLLVCKIGNKNVPMTRQIMQTKLGLSDSTFERFMTDVRKHELIYSSERKYYINPKYFTKGKCEFDNKCYTRIYIDTTRFLFENIKVSQHKQLSYIFQLIPKIHYNINVVCKNPDEHDTNKIQKMTLTEICEFLNVSKNNATNLKKNLLKFHVNVQGYKFHLFNYISIENSETKRDYFAINPNLIWKGNNINDIKDIIKCLFFS